MKSTSKESIIAIKIKDIQLKAKKYLFAPSFFGYNLFNLFKTRSRFKHIDSDFYNELNLEVKNSPSVILSCVHLEDNFMSNIDGISINTAINQLSKQGYAVHELTLDHVRQVIKEKTLREKLNFTEDDSALFLVRSKLNELWELRFKFKNEGILLLLNKTKDSSMLTSADYLFI